MSWIKRIFGKHKTTPPPLPTAPPPIPKNNTIQVNIKVPDGWTPPSKEEIEARPKFNAHPYRLLRLGPAEKRCPLHSQFEGLLLECEHPFWDHFEIGRGGHKHCKCWVQKVTQKKRDEYVQNGVPSRGKPILDEKGNLTGKHEEKTIPAITEI